MPDAMQDAATLLRHALALHQQGQLAAAETEYRAVLRMQPQQFDATHLLGVIARQRGEFQLAADWIGKAIAIDAGHAIAHGNLGTALQALGRSEAALASHERALALKPDYAMAWYNRGNALRSLERPDEALQSYARALQLQPAYAEAWCGQGALLQALGRAGAALDSVDRALRLQPDSPDALFARGLALHGLQRYEEALLSYQRAIAVRPVYAEAFFNRGNAFQRLQRHAEALDSHEQALRLRPGYAGAHRQRGHALRALGRPEDAIAAYRQALECGAGQDEIGYALAALGAAATPAAAPASYVRELFDQYAGHFERHLTEVLAYDMPRLLAAAAGRQLPAAATADVLDLGCGTGLCGPWLRPFARTLAGVDLSQNMLDKAAAKGVYDHLVCAELGDFLSGQEDSADLAVAADVFVYIGDLSAVFGGLRKALRPRGLLVFSVEAAAEGGAGFILQPSHRYAHTLAYLRQLAAQHGFAVKAVEECVGR
ncbi:MAG TPA: tetratricopeptide repeat protein, partial [Janthinobacterium sp.]|nr:tetratricopeptide repeat protein [Janthinobacterium sp.]